MRYTRLWIGLAFVLVAAFAGAGLLWWGDARQAPPVPERVVTSDGAMVFTGQDLRDGQNVWHPYRTLSNSLEPCSAILACYPGNTEVSTPSTG